MEEIWKDIEGYEGLYQVSNLGRVKSLPNCRHKTEKIMKQWVSGGYYQIVLTKNGEEKHHYVHRLVAETFVPNPDNLPQVGHKDENNFKTGDRCNNCVDNLYWTTALENSNTPKHCQRQSEAQMGEKNHMYGKHVKDEVKKSTSVPVLCVETGKIYYGLREAERQTGVGHSNIKQCCEGKYKQCNGFHWRYVAKEEAEQVNKGDD